MNLTPSLRRILIALDRDGDMAPADIAEAAHVSLGTLQSGYLTKLLVMGLVRVSRWERNAVGPFIPVYSVSKGESKPKPEPYTVAEKCKRWKKRAGYYRPDYKQRQQARHSMNELLRITA